MAADVADAIVHFSSTGAYPDNEDIISTELSSDVLIDVLGTLQKARADVRKEVEVLSKTTGANVERWIVLAKELQTDIQRSRDVARSIVEENEAASKLEEQVRDAAAKVELLEREIEYETTLEDTLLQIGHANNVLLQTQDAVVTGDVTHALKLLHAARNAVTALEDAASTKAVTILDLRGRHLKSTIEDNITQAWANLFHVDVEQGTLEISQQAGDNVKATLQTIACAAEDTGILTRLIEKLSKDIDRLITQRILSKIVSDQRVHVVVRNTVTEASFVSDEVDGDSSRLASFFGSLIDFFSTQLPEPIRTAFADKYLPLFVNRLEENWLGPSIPTDVNVVHIEAFSRTVEYAEKLAAQLDVLKWPGATQLRDWCDNVPKAWLTKRRETLLGAARDVVFEKVHETKTVQRVETEVIATEVEAGADDGDEDWDNGWEEGDEDRPANITVSTASASKTAQPQDEDDGSAWDVDDTAETATNSSHNDDEAWGWGDDANQNTDKGPSSPVRTMTKPKTSSPSAGQKTQTLSETYTVTAIPDSLFDMVEAIITDAQTLTQAEYASSALAQAAAALYSLPTLALAIYRATAPTAYAELSAGNMMIYSDATRLSERLRAWQASQPTASRLRLDHDAKALDDFARRAYGAEMDAQRTIMQDLLDGAQGFNNCTVPPFKAACESAVEEVVDRLHDVHQAWKGILAPSALPQAVGQLLSTLTGKMISDVEDLSDISEPESRQLRALCDRVSSVKVLFTRDDAGGGLSDLTFVYCPNWLKFQYLGEILESSLADIRYLWTEGELSLEFEADEVVDLIKALFAESDKRRQAITEVRRGGHR